MVVCRECVCVNCCLFYCLRFHGNAATHSPSPDQIHWAKPSVSCWRHHTLTVRLCGSQFMRTQVLHASVAMGLDSGHRRFTSKCDDISPWRRQATFSGFPWLFVEFVLNIPDQTIGKHTKLMDIWKHNVAEVVHAQRICSPDTHDTP